MRFLTVVFCFAILFSCQSAKQTNAGNRSALPVKEWKLDWSDEFNYDGLPDSTKWNYDVGGDGWGNNELQYYTKNDTANAVVKNGALHIIARPSANSKNKYTSARLVTRGKKHFEYGKVEVRAKFTKGLGTWPAIWMLGENIKTAGWPLCGEIDIMEHVGYMPDSVFGSVHTQTYNHVKGTQKTTGVFMQNLYDDFHIYSIEWNKEEINFMVDNKAFLKFANEHKTEKEWPFSQPFYLLLNFAVGGNWGGAKGIDATAFPATMQVDYVRVFTN